MLKDVGIAVSLARSVGGPAPLGEETARLWAEAAEALPRDADHTEIARWVGERADAATASAAAVRERARPDGRE
jgi:3-hydroxyisobutyrate dehydrogenase